MESQRWGRIQSADFIRDNFSGEARFSLMRDMSVWVDWKTSEDLKRGKNRKK